MKRITFLLIVVFPVLLSLTSIAEFDKVTAGASNPLTVELLSTHSQTSADTFLNNYGYGIETSGDVAHFYWQESGNGAEGTDLFYRQLPGGSTIRLSAPAQSEGDVSQVWFDTAVAPDGTFHIIWLEDTGTAEGGDLFYWSAATGTLRLSDHSQTEGYVQPALNTLYLILDGSGNPHTYWYEETGTGEGEDLFYWSPLEGTVLLTNRNLTEGDDVDFGPNALLTDDNGNTHITWAEYGNDGFTSSYFYWNASLPAPINLPGIRSFAVAGNVAHIIWQSATEGPIVYWNSSTQIPQSILSSADAPGGIIQTSRLIKDSTGTIHLFWLKGIAGICLAHWDTVSQTTEDIVSGDDCYPFWDVFLDGSDNFHTIVVDQTMSGRRYRYWNNTLATPILIPIGSSINQGKLTGIEGTNQVHLTWTETNGSDDNYYHWDNLSQSVTNLSQLAGADTHISSMGIQVLSSSNNELYMLWSEAISGTGTFHNLYWNSSTDTTVDLFTELGVDSINSNFGTMKINFLADGKPYTIWPGTPISGPTGFYVWDRSKEIVHLAGESSPCSDIGRYYSSEADEFGNIYLAWQDDGTKTSYLWSQTSGQVDLSQTSAAETNCVPPLVAVSDNGRVFALWIEESDVAGEGLDVYGGWIESPSSSIYLPMVAR